MRRDGAGTLSPRAARAAIMRHHHVQPHTSTPCASTHYYYELSRLPPLLPAPDRYLLPFCFMPRDARLKAYISLRARRRSPGRLPETLSGERRQGLGPEPATSPGQCELRRQACVRAASPQHTELRHCFADCFLS